MEYVRDIKVTIEVDTNKRTLKHVITNESTLGEAVDKTIEVFETIEESIG